MDNKLQIVDTIGRPMKSEPNKKSFPNLDMGFFKGAGNSTITAKQIKENPYRYQVWVHGAANAIARNISKLPMVISEKGDPTNVLEDKWNIIHRLSHPNQTMTRTTFIEMIILNLLLPSGANNDPGGQSFLLPRNAFTEMGDGKVDLSKGIIPDVLHPYNSSFFKPALSKPIKGMSQVEGWTFEIPNVTSSKTVYQSNELIRIYQPNPNNWLGGISNFEPARIAITQDVLSDLYNTGLYDNNSIPSGIISAEGYLKNDQRKDIMKSWHENFGGVGNQGKTAVLDASSKYQAIGLTPADMQYKDMKNDAFERIAASFMVNKIAFGIYEDLNFATIREGIKFLWTDTYQPLAALILEPINEQWIRYIDERIELRFDYSNIDALQKDFSKPASAYKSLVEGGMPLVIAARINNIPLTKQDIIDNPHLLEASPKFMNGGVNTTEDKEDIDDKKIKRIKSEEPIDEPTEDTHKAAMEKFSINFIEKVLTPGEKKYKKVMDRLFYSQRNAMQSKVDLWEKENKAVKTLKDKLIRKIPLKTESFLFNISEENKKLEKLFKPLIKDQLELTETQLASELDGLIAWNVTNEMVDEFVQLRKSGINNINTTTFNKAGKEILKVIEGEMAENATIQEIAKALKDSIGDALTVRRGQAEMIARTETGIITNTARFEAFKKEGVEYHEWVTAADERVRTTPYNHSGTGGMVVKVGKTFEPVGLIYPLDPDGEAGNIINCRCVAVATTKP